MNDLSRRIFKHYSFSRRLTGESLPLTIAIILSLLVQLLITEQSDDLWIWMRYAKNFWQGAGLVYNIGGERVEGFSNPLFVFINAPLFLIFSDPVWFVQLENMFFGMVGLIYFHKLSRLMTSNKLVHGFSLLLWVLSYYIHSHIRGGMETVLYTAFLLLSVYYLFIGLRRNQPVLIALCGIVLGLASITRPEGVLFYITVIVFVCFSRQERKVILLLIAGLIIPVCYFVFRVNYFGYPFPNTFYAKFPSSRVDGMIAGWHYILSFMFSLKRVPLILIFASYGLLQSRFFRKPQGLFLLMILAESFYILMVGGDYFSSYRFIYPVLPFILLLMADGAVRLVAWAKRFVEWVDGTRYSKFTVLLGLLLGFRVFWGILQPFLTSYENIKQNAISLTNVIAGNKSFEEYLIPSNRFSKLGILFHEKLDNQGVLALVSAGGIPYYSNMPVLDMLGLNDVQLAHDGETKPGGHSKGNAALILLREPKYILLNPFILDKPTREPVYDSVSYKPVVDLWASDEFHKLYEPLDLITPDGMIVTVWERVP